MNEGQQILDTNPGAYKEWIDSQDFGVRERYVPLARTTGVTPSRQGSRGVGKGFTKPRTARYIYNHKRPLFREISSYFKRALSIQKLEPKVDDLHTILNEHGLDIKENIQLLDNWENILFGVSKIDPVLNIIKRTQGVFWKVNIPQKLAKWVSRNLMQPTVYVLPKLFHPTSHVFWKNLGSLYSGFRSADVFKGNKQLLEDPVFVDNFRRYVSSLDSLRQEYFFMGDEISVAPINKISNFLAEISKAYSWSDEVNRIRALITVYNISQDRLKIYRKNPSKANLHKFLGDTGGLLIEDLELKDVLKLVDLGQDKEASFLLGKIMADNANFMYKRAFKGLGEQAPTGQAILTIFTFAKGSAQDITMRGLRPFLKWSKAYNRYRRGEGPSPDPALVKRAYNGIIALLAMYFASVGVNKFQEKAYGVKEGSYGVNTLRWIPGGVFISIYTRLAEEFWGVMQQRKNWDYKLAQTANAFGRSFVPFYDMATKVVANQTGVKYYSPPLELRNWIKKMAGSNNEAKIRKYVERTTLEQFQNVLFGGAPITQPEDMVEDYLTYLDYSEKYGETDRRTQRIAKKLEREIRLYPVAPGRKEELREIWNIESVMPSIGKKVLE